MCTGKSLAYGCAAQLLYWVWQKRGSRSSKVQAQGDNYLTSTIPASWLRAGSFPKLAVLGLAQNQLVGTIPTPQPNCGLCGFKVRAPLWQ